MKGADQVSVAQRGVGATYPFFRMLLRMLRVPFTAGPISSGGMISACRRSTTMLRTLGIIRLEVEWRGRVLDRVNALNRFIERALLMTIANQRATLALSARPRTFVISSTIASSNLSPYERK